LLAFFLLLTVCIVLLQKLRNDGVLVPGIASQASEKMLTYATPLSPSRGNSSKQLNVEREQLTSTDRLSERLLKSGGTSGSNANGNWQDDSMASAVHPVNHNSVSSNTSSYLVPIHAKQNAAGGKIPSNSTEGVVYRPPSFIPADAAVGNTATVAITHSKIERTLSGGSRASRESNSAHSIQAASLLDQEDINQDF
jgi:hypothetical protein